VSAPEVNAGAFGSSFSGVAVIDLKLSALFTQSRLAQLAGDHVIEFRVFTPHGHLYQSISVPFSADTKSKGQKRDVTGYPRPIPVEVLSKVTFETRSYWAATVTLPVGGTTITTNSMYGAWTAKAFIDGDGVPCGTDAIFTITP